MRMISRSVQISIAGGEGDMVRNLSLGSFFFFFFFMISWVICFRYEKGYARRAMKRKKPISHNNLPQHLLIGKFKHPETIGEAPSPST